MRHLISGFVGFWGVALMPAASGAGSLQLEELVAKNHGATSCWQRVYSDEHLAAHPDQKVRELRLSVSYHVYDDPYGQYSFGYDALRRGEGEMGGDAGVCWNKPEGVACHIECDGGGFMLRRARNKGDVLFDLEYVGFLTMRGGCGDFDGEGGVMEPLVPGLDDKLFLLHPANCAALFGED